MPKSAPDARPNEIEHHYGAGIHILSDLFLQSHLTRLCAPNTVQPAINHHLITIYQHLLRTVVAREFPKCAVETPTRMAEAHPREGVFRGEIIDPQTRAVSVNLARAGTLPSHVCYDALNSILNPALVRQDHISIARKADAQTHQVTGSEISGHKIGGDINDAILLIPDPMGATGSTVVEILDLYLQTGKPRAVIAIHCIITPEYLKKVRSRYPEIVVYAARLDRGLSPESVLKTVPGTHPDQERGLNDRHYIVPGGGGFGEVLNNAFV